MKISALASPCRKTCAFRLLWPLILAFASSLPVAAVETAPAEPKTHTLFMGVDFSVEYKKELHRVVDVVGDSFVIAVKGKEVRVPMNHGSGSFKIDPVLKIAERSATVNSLKGERAYTLANDPDAILLRNLANSERLMADAEVAMNQANAGLHSWDMAKAQIDASAKADPHSGVSATPAGNERASIGQQNAQLSMQRIAGGPGARFQASGSTLSGEGAYDAMDVSFELSSDRPLNRPYVVILVQYHPVDGKPGQLTSWIYARALAPIARDPAKVQVDRGGVTPTFTARNTTLGTKVHIVQGGFPPGFELQEFQVHLYDQGEEVATNVAPKRVPLTRDEAFEYVKLQYVGSHKGATLPATPAMGKLPADFPDRVARGEFNQTVYAKVDREGRAVDVFRDASCSERVNDPYLTQLLQNLRFRPALDQGKPVEGVAALNLKQLSL